MRAVRAIALGVAMLIAAPFCAVEGTAHAQVWKPRSRQKKKTQGAPTAEAKSVATKTRKPKPARIKHVAKKKRPAAKKSKRHVKKPPPDDDDDDFTIVEEDFPDED